MAETHKRLRRRIENAIVLDIGELRAWGWLKAGVYERYWRLQGVHEPRLGLLRLDIDDTQAALRVSFAGTQHVVNLECSVPPFGGRRWWLVCPLTGRRARKLYFFPDLKDFRHREAVDPPLSYPIQRTSGLNRVLFRRNVLTSKTHDPCTLTGKPARMRWKTYFRYVAKDRSLEALETSMILARIMPKNSR